MAASFYAEQRCLLCALRGVQGRLGWESEQPGLVEGWNLGRVWNQMNSKVPSNANLFEIL